MREILFKGKSKRDGQWVVGSYVNVGNGVHQIWVAFPKQEREMHKGMAIEGDYGYWEEIIPETLCEFTGLCDKNGKRIWENDIVHLTDVRYDTEWRAIVEFGNPYGEYTWGWNFYHIGEKAKVNTDILLWAEMEDVEVYCEVIGNRFDNAELLTAERGK